MTYHRMAVKITNITSLQYAINKCTLCDRKYTFIHTFIYIHISHTVANSFDRRVVVFLVLFGLSLCVFTVTSSPIPVIANTPSFSFSSLSADWKDSSFWTYCCVCDCCCFCCGWIRVWRCCWRGGACLYCWCCCCSWFSWLGVIPSWSKCVRNSNGCLLPFMLTEWDTTTLLPPLCYNILGHWWIIINFKPKSMWREECVIDE